MAKNRKGTHTLILTGALIVTLVLLASTTYLLYTQEQGQTSLPRQASWPPEDILEEKVLNATPNPGDAGIGVTFTSWSEIETFIDETLPSYRGGGVWAPVAAVNETAMPVTTAGIPETAGEAAIETTPASSPVYGGGEVQVEGVSELDVVATDGYRIYVSSDGTLVAVSALPPEAMSIVWRFNASSFVSALVGDAEIIASDRTGNRTIGIARPSATMEGAFVSDGKIVAVIDVSWSGAYVMPPETWIVVLDPETGLPTSLLPISGSLLDARLNGDNLVVVSVLPSKINGVLAVPRIMDREVNASDVAVIGKPYAYTMLVSLNVSGGEFSYVTLLGPRPAAMYMDRENKVLLALPNPVEELISPLPGTLVPAVEVVVDEGESRESLLALYRAEPENTYLEAYQTIPGIVRTQWMMDIRGDQVRVVSETGSRWMPDVNLYIYNITDLAPIGNVTSIAVNERVHASLFTDDTLYLVTFRSIDPLFTIDLSNPAEPTVLGYLEGPGFDEFLRPVGEDILVGVGTEGGFVRLTLYRINDDRTVSVADRVYFPSVEDYYYCYSWSQALEAGAGHRAITINREAQVVMIPVHYTCYNGSMDVSKSGILVVGYSSGGLEPLGFLEHKYVSRSVYIGDVIYSVAPINLVREDPLVKAWSLESFELISAVNG